MTLSSTSAITHYVAGNSFYHPQLFSVSTGVGGKGNGDKVGAEVSKPGHYQTLFSWYFFESQIIQWKLVCA